MSEYCLKLISKLAKVQLLVKMMQRLQNGMFSHFTSGCHNKIVLAPSPPPPDGVLLQLPMSSDHLG